MARKRSRSDEDARLAAQIQKLEADLAEIPLRRAELDAEETRKQQEHDRLLKQFIREKITAAKGSFTLDAFATLLESEDTELGDETALSQTELSDESSQGQPDPTQEIEEGENQCD